MTEFMNPDRLQQIADVTEQPSLSRRRATLIMQWTADVETARPVSRWVLDESPGSFPHSSQSPE
jgi:hypothetical protein